MRDEAQIVSPLARAPTAAARMRGRTQWPSTSSTVRGFGFRVLGFRDYSGLGLRMRV